MRNITKLMFTIVLLIGTVGGVNSKTIYATPSNGTQTWDANTSTFTWNGTSNNYIELGLPTGDIRQYTNIHFTISDFTANTNPFVRLVVKNGKDNQITENLVTGENNIDLVSKYPNWDFSCVSSIQLFGSNSAPSGYSIDSEHPASCEVTNIYMYKPTKLYFDEIGRYITDLTELKAEGGLSFDATTGELTTNGEAGTLTLELDESVNLDILKSLEIKRSGDDGIIDKLEFYQNGSTLNQSWSYYKWGGDNNANAISSFTGKPINKIVWVSNQGKSTSLKITINSIIWQLMTMSAMKGTDISTLPYKAWDNDGDNDASVTGEATPTYNFGTYTDGVVYGKQDIGDSKNYIDLTNYQKLIIRGFGTIRLFYNWHKKTGDSDTESKPIDATSFVNSTTEVQTMELDIPSFLSSNNISHFHLIGIKPSGSCYVEGISVITGNKSAEYNITRKGARLASVDEILSNSSTKSIDVTGMEESSVTLSSTNPNCLFVAKAGTLANANNVIVNNTCASLVLTDNNPYKAPADFTATSATYTTTINTTAKAGTVCLPFAATIPEGVKAYTLTYTSGTVATADEITGTIPANTPVLLNGEGEVTFTGSNAEIDADAANTAGAMTGVFEQGYVPMNSYVLQKQGDVLAFYKVASENTITIKPFRAYLTAQPGGGARMFIVYNDSSTGIDATLMNNEERIMNNEIYNLSGQRIDGSRLNPGIYIKNGQKVVVK